MEAVPGIAFASCFLALPVDAPTAALVAPVAVEMVAVVVVVVARAHAERPGVP